MSLEVELDMFFTYQDETTPFEEMSGTIFQRGQTISFSNHFEKGQVHFTSEPLERAFRSEAAARGLTETELLQHLIREYIDRKLRHEAARVDGRPFFDTRVARKEMYELCERPSFAKVIYASPRRSDHHLEVWKAPDGTVHVHGKRPSSVAELADAANSSFGLGVSDDEFERIKDHVQGLVSLGQVRPEVYDHRELFGDRAHPQEALWSLDSVDRYLLSINPAIDVVQRREQLFRPRR
jgi:hypothetical protein